MSQLTIHLLGAPGIARDGAPITVDTRKATALLAYLAVTGRSHAREALAALLWPEYDDEHARSALRRTLSTLRAALDAPHLVIDRDTVSLVPGAGLWVDVAEFRARMAACRTHGHPAADVCHACLAPLAEAAALYRDDFLAGFTLRDSAEFDDWQFMQAETLRGELVGALEKLARGQSARGDFAGALVSARRWLALDPLREEAHRQVMRLYAWADQRNAALHQYRACVRILEQELGVAPLAETTELYEAVKGNRLSPPADLANPEEPDRWQSGPDTDLAGDQKPARLLPLVGRGAELMTLIRAYERHGAGGYFVALEGEAGIGKTRLAEEFLARVRDQGAMTITVRCYEGEANVAYGPVAGGLRGALAQSACADRLEALPVHWLAEAARLLPELGVLCPGLPPPPPLDAPGGQSRFYEGLRQVLSAICQGATPNVLFFDDMHWADTASLDLLAYLVRRLAGQPLFILATWRSDEAPAVSRLRALVAEAQRAGLGTALMLKRLALADVLDIVRDLSAAGVDLPDGISGRLYHETEGLPLFLAAYLEALAQSEAKGAGETWPVPRGVANLLQARLDAVEETARQALQAASVIGRSFDLGTLQATSGRSDEEIVFALEALASRGIVTEVAEEAGAPRDTTSPMRSCGRWSMRRRAWHDDGCCMAVQPGRSWNGRASAAIGIPSRARSAGTSGWPGKTPTLRPVSSQPVTMPTACMPTPRRWRTTRMRWPWAMVRRAAYTRRSATCTRSWAPTPRRSAVTKPLRRCANHQTQPWPRSSTSWGRSTLAAASGQPPRRTSRPRWTLPAPRLSAQQPLASWPTGAWLPTHKGGPSRRQRWPLTHSRPPSPRAIRSAQRKRTTSWASWRAAEAIAPAPRHTSNAALPSPKRCPIPAAALRRSITWPWPTPTAATWRRQQPWPSRRLHWALLWVTATVRLRCATTWLTCFTPLAAAKRR